MSVVPRGTWHGGGLVALAFMGASACTAPDPGPSVFVGRHVTVHTNTSTWICAASLESADRFLEVTAAYLHASVPSIRYDLFRAGVDFGCGGSEVDGCAFADESLVRARYWVIEHELVHVIGGQIGYPPAFLEEGLAVALDHDPVLQQTLAHGGTQLPFEDALESIEFRALSVQSMAQHYLGAGAFVRYAIERFGIDAVRTWYATTPKSADALSVRVAFAHASGVDFDSAVADWRSRPRPELQWPPQFGPFTHCDDAPATPLADGSIHIDAAAPSCDPQLVRTGGALPLTPEPFSDFHTFDIATDALHAMRLSSNGTINAVVTACPSLTVRATAFTQSTSPTMTVLASLAPGRYRAEFYGPFTAGVDAVPATLDARPIGREGAACHDAPSVTLDAANPTVAFAADVSRWTLRDVSAGGSEQAVAWLDVAVTDASPVFVSPGLFANASMSVRVCEGSCDAPSACVTFRGGQTAPLPFQPSGAGTLHAEMFAPTDAQRPLFIFSLRAL